MAQLAFLPLLTTGWRVRLWVQGPLSVRVIGRVGGGGGGACIFSSVKLRLDCAENQRVCVFQLFFFFFTHFLDLQLLFNEQSPQILTFQTFFSQSVHIVYCSRTHKFHFLVTFFIKNGSHGTIHTFKNYFVTVFFSFQFQFSVFNGIQTDP